VIFDDEPEKMIIDSNEASNEIVLSKEREYKEMLMEEERQRRLEALAESGEEIPEGVEPEEFLDLADTLMEEEKPDFTEEREEVLRQAREEADVIISSANAEASSIIEAANTNAEALKALAREDGHREGYNDGSQKAAAEVATAKASMDHELELIKQDFLEKELSMGREIMATCCQLMEKVFAADLSGNQQVLFHLLDNCLMNIEPSRQMQVKVGETNLEFVRSKKDDIMARVGSDVTIDIIGDPLLDNSQCIIETDGGLFDCSIDTQLEGIIKKIRALS